MAQPIQTQDLQHLNTGAAIVTVVEFIGPVDVGDVVATDRWQDNSP